MDFLRLVEIKKKGENHWKMAEFRNRVEPDLEEELLSEGKKADLAYKYSEFSEKIPDEYIAKGYEQYDEYPVVHNTPSGFQAILLYNKKSKSVEFLIAGTDEIPKDMIDNWFPHGAGRQAEDALRIFAPIYYSAIRENKKIKIYGDSGAGYIIDRIERQFPGVSTFITNSGSYDKGASGSVSYFLHPEKYAYSNAYVENYDYNFPTDEVTHTVLINYGEFVSRITPPRSDKQIFYKISPDAMDVVNWQKRGFSPFWASVFGGGFGIHRNRSGKENSLLSPGTILNQEPETEEFLEKMSFSIDLGSGMIPAFEEVTQQTVNGFNIKEKTFPKDLFSEPPIDEKYQQNISRPVIDQGEWQQQKESSFLTQVVEYTYSNGGKVYQLPDGSKMFLEQHENIDESKYKIVYRVRYEDIYHSYEDEIKGIQMNQYR